MADRILVPFDGVGAGAGELSWGQREMWSAMCRTGSSLGIGGVLPLPEGTTVGRAADMVSFMLSRHQSLRTRLRLRSGGPPVQVVSGVGEVPLEIVDTGGDPAEAADQLWNRYHDVEFDYANEFPVRMAVVRRRGRPTHLVSLCCHLACDGFGLAALRADLFTMDHGPAPVTASQPLDQTRWQRGASGRRQSAAALDYWARIMRTIPAERFAAPADPAGSSSQEVSFRSPAAHLAARILAARNVVPTSPVLLAAFAVALDRVTGVRPVVAQVVVSNRFRPGLADSVSTINHPGLCTLDVSGIDFDEAVGRAWQAQLRAYKNAYYDPAAKERLVAGIEAQRGERIELGCFFNDRRGTGRPEPDGAVPAAAEVRAALPLTTLRWVPPLDPVSEPFFCHLNDVPGVLDVRLTWDARRVARADAEQFLCGMEATLVEAVRHPAALRRG
jgi:hypothetical protein